MKFIGTLIATLFLSASPVMALNGIHPGSYTGTGEWTSENGTSGRYTVATTIDCSPVAACTISSTYRYGSENEVWEFTLLPVGNNFFSVFAGADEGGKIGEAYCFDVQCHYTAFDGKLEETLSFVDGKLYKLGSKNMGPRKIKWQEALSLRARE